MVDDTLPHRASTVGGPAHPDASREGGTDDAAPLIVPLSEAGGLPVTLVGGKARQLGRLMGEGYRVPDGFVITTAVDPDTELFRTSPMAPGRRPGRWMIVALDT